MTKHNTPKSNAQFYLILFEFQKTMTVPITSESASNHSSTTSLKSYKNVNILSSTQNQKLHCHVNRRKTLFTNHRNTFASGDVYILQGKKTSKVPLRHGRERVNLFAEFLAIVPF